MKGGEVGYKTDHKMGVQGQKLHKLFFPVNQKSDMNPGLVDLNVIKYYDSLTEK